MSASRNDKLIFWLKVVVAALVIVAGAQSLLLWGLGRKVPVLSTLANTGVADEIPQKVQDLTLAQLVEGLARLDGEPHLLLNKEQANRLVPLIPLFRQALFEGASEEQGVSIAHFGSMLKQYIFNTLTKSQVQHLQALVSDGQLGSTNASAIERLPALDKSLRQRVGMTVERSAVYSPIRRSLDKMRIRDLILGMLLLEADPDARITRDQAALMVPMVDMLQEVFERGPEVLGESSIPVVEAQVRSILSDYQQQRLFEAALASGIHNLEVDEDELISQFGTLLVNRGAGGVFKFRLHSLMAPTSSVREGPAVIPGKSEIELLTAIRGIVMHLEPNPKLRLDKEQVEELKLIAPGIEQCLVNLLNRVKDLRLPEFQGRVLRILRAEQINYILQHKSDPIPASDYKPGEEPTANELKRFLEAREAGITYSPLVKMGALPARAKSADGSLSVGSGDEGPVVDSTPETPRPQTPAAPKTPEAVKAATTPIFVPPAPEEAVPERPLDQHVITQSPGAKPGVKERFPSQPLVQVNVQSSPGERPGVKQRFPNAPLVQVNAPNAPGVRPGIKKRYPSQKKRLVEPNKPGKRPAPTNPVKLPLEAVVRGILFTLESNPSLCLKPAQVTAIADRLAEYKAGLNEAENSDTRSDKVIQLTKDLYALLSVKQRKYLELNEKSSRVGLQPGSGESALSRELERFTKARLNGKMYKPLMNQEGNTEGHQ